MAIVDLEENEWQQVISILATASWRDANPLLMKIGKQLQNQQTAPAPPLGIKSNRGDGKELEQ